MRHLSPLSLEGRGVGGEGDGRAPNTVASCRPISPFALSSSKGLMTSGTAKLDCTPPARSMAARGQSLSLLRQRKEPKKGDPDDSPVSCGARVRRASQKSPECCANAQPVGSYCAAWTACRCAPRGESTGTRSNRCLIASRWSHSNLAASPPDGPETDQLDFGGELVHGWAGRTPILTMQRTRTITSNTSVRRTTAKGLRVGTGTAENELEATGLTEP